MPWSRQSGVVPPQAEHAAPQAVFDLHTWQAPLVHCWLVPQAAQAGPHFWLVVQFAHTLAVQYFPGPQCPSAVHATQAVPAVLQTCAVDVQFTQLAPQLASVLHALQVPESHHLPALQSVLVVQSLQTPFEHPKGQLTSVVA